MTRSVTLLAVCFVAQAGFSQAETMHIGKTAVIFARVAEGGRILGMRDDYVQRMSPFDRAARLKTAKQVSEEEFLKYVDQSVLAWSDAEKQAVESAFGRSTEP